ncbi:capsule assembly Wzi family protein [Rhizobacter sp. LjRoot28]|uniref:capsule assembly Wzi family protein n=1 Tax=Rhizobacter sp. LjRoot28 TaxID=3342309 RepID=UPI003ECD1477
MRLSRVRRSAFSPLTLLPCLAALLPAAAHLQGRAATDPDAEAQQRAPCLVLLAPGDRGLRSDLAWLVDRRVLDLPLSTWPLPSPLLRAALSRVDASRLAAVDSDALARVQRALDRSASPARLTGRLNTGAHPSLDGSDAAKGSAAARLGAYAGGPDWGGQFTVAATADRLWAGDGGPVNLDGSYLALGTRWAVVSAGVSDRWWGPGQYASPILSNAARPIASVIVRRAEDTAPSTPLLSWVGAWGYELSAGRLSGYDPAGTRTIGMRFYTRPWPNVELGFSRSILWGGHGRPRDTGALWRALRGDSNIDDPARRGEDPSDEVAGFDLRVSGQWPDDSTWAAYLHIVGEDEAGGLPAKRFGTVGLQARTLVGNQRVEAVVEATDTVTSRLFGLSSGPSTGPAAIHGTYVDGYYQGGLPIGAHIGGGGDLLSFGFGWIPIDHPAALRINTTVFHGDVNGSGPQPINAAFSEPGSLSGFTFMVEGEALQRRSTWQVGLSAQRYAGSSRPTFGLLAGFSVPLFQSP